MNRAWTFIISDPLNNEQLSDLKRSGEEFVGGWTAHDIRLSGSFEIFRDRIIVVKVNEDTHAASGCSIDKLTRFIKETELNYQVQLMNRLLVAYNDAKGELKINSSAQIKEKLTSGELSADTEVYNTAVADEKELGDWLQPLKNTWLNKFLTRV